MSALAEQAVIGIMLLEPDGSAEVYDHLTAGMFEAEPLGRVFACCKKLRSEGLRADAAAVSGRLGESFIPLLARCAETVPAMSGLSTYITVVMDDWRQRTLTSQLAQLAVSGLDADALTAELGRIVARQEHILAHQRQTTAKEFRECVDEFLSWCGEEDRAIKTGFARLDRITGGLQPGGVTAIAARSGRGKTTLAVQLATQIARTRPVCYLSLEMSRVQVTAGVVSMASGVNSRSITGRTCTPAEREKVEKVARWLAESFKLVIDDRPLQTLTDVEGCIRQRKPEVLFIDHLGLLTPEKGREKRNDELAALTRGLKELAMRYGIHIVELIQASRQAEGRKVSMADMFGSATIEHDADMVIGVNPESGFEGMDTCRAEIDVLKNRHGPGGTFPFLWNRSTHRFVPIED